MKTQKGKYTLLKDHTKNYGIIVVDDKGARWILRPDAMFMEYEVMRIWDELTTN